MNTAAVNFSDRRGWYQDGQARFFHSMHLHGFIGNDLGFQSLDQLPGCPSHAQTPYAFKLYAIQEAKRLGYSVIFYGDASIYAVNSVTPVFKHIAKHGYYLEATEHNLGTWSSDAALAQLGLDRDTAFSIPTLVAGCIGFDFRRNVACQVFDAWMRLAQDGVSFRGSWTNACREVSADPRVRGHRHDQTALSGIAHSMKLTVLPYQTYIYYPTPPPPQAVFHCHPTI